jgi:hypothetical protein
MLTMKQDSNNSMISYWKEIMSDNDVEMIETTIEEKKIAERKQKKT